MATKSKKSGRKVAALAAGGTDSSYWDEKYNQLHMALAVAYLVFFRDILKNGNHAAGAKP